MDLFDQRDWSQLLKVILNLYKDRKFPLNYTNNYQLLVVVVLSAQDSDANINKLTPHFFKHFPDFTSITYSNVAELTSYFIDVENINTKTKWIFEIAHQLHLSQEIPLTMNELLQLKGVGRKSANAILRENNIKAVGILVDLHVIRVSTRLGIAQKSNDGNQIEKQLMQQLPTKIWKDVGMALSFLGREICRPKNPKCFDCPLQKDCTFYNQT